MKCEKEEDKYFEDILDICSPCSELCSNHQALGTTQECSEKCKGKID